MPRLCCLSILCHISQERASSFFCCAGAYNKVLNAKQQVPSELHKPLMEQLAVTVRDEIASCSEKAYSHLKVKDAQKMMMFDTERAVAEYAQQHGWQIQDGRIMFQARDAGDGKEIPAMGLINNALVYAKELERIV